MKKPMKQIPSTVTPPKTNYSYLRNLDASGWYGELTRIYKLSIDHGLGLHEQDPNIHIIHTPNGTDIIQIGGPYVSFIVNVNIPDALLVLEFKRWISEVRQQLKLPISKSGRASLNTKFDRIKFHGWMNAKIIEYADILMWRSQLSQNQQKTWNRAAIGRFIGRHSSKDVNSTERILKQALKCIVSLGAQIEHEMSQGANTNKLIAERISKQILP